MAGAKVVLSADFHAYAQSQRAHFRLLRDHLGPGPVVLALECLGAEHEKTAADFLSGVISEARFLEVIGWDKNWGFPWESYRPLFELARDLGFRIRGLNHGAGTGSLAKRDSWTTRKIFGFLN